MKDMKKVVPSPSEPQGPPQPRESSSFPQQQAIDSAHVPADAGKQITTAKSSVNRDYRRLSTTEERVAACIRIYKRELVGVHGTPDSTLAFDEDTVEEFMERQKANGLTEAEVLLVYRRIVFLQILEKAGFDPNRVLILFLRTLMGFVDLGTDIATMMFYASVNPVIAIVQGGILAFSFAMQCISSLALGQPLWVGLMGLIGLKPAVEAWRDAIVADEFKGQKVGNDLVTWVCKTLEMVVSWWAGCVCCSLSRLLKLTYPRSPLFDSDSTRQTETIPQALVQIVALLLTGTAAHSPIQVVSLAFSLLTAGSAIALTDRALDKDKARRKLDPLLFGYVPMFKNGRHRQLQAMIVFFGTYMGAKMFALSVLVSRGGILLVAAWLVAEYGLLLVVRVAIGNWRLYRKGAGGVGGSVLAHLMVYLGLLAAPFPLLRSPTFLTARVYSGGLLYMLLVNFVQIGLAFRYFDSGSVDEATAWAILLAVTAVCALSGTVAFFFVPRSHKKTFYEHLTLKQHVETFWWNEATVWDLRDDKWRSSDPRESIRALLPTWFSIQYLPIEKCKTFYRENWKRWEEEQPDWFDDDFKAAVPIELRPND